MSDWLIDAIRRVDPCPNELPAPPIEDVLRRLREEPPGAEPVSTGRRRPARGAAALVLSSAVVLATAVLAIVVLGHTRRAGSPPVSAGQRAGVLAGACRSLVKDRVLPVWARTGFSDPRPRMTYTLGASGRIAAIPFGSLDSPPAADHNNKILWVSHVEAQPGRDLTISAQRMDGGERIGEPVKRTVMGGPGPSIINLPSPGCWRFTLHWSGWSDQLDLQYSRAG
jgi:hypothetical protein